MTIIELDFLCKFTTFKFEVFDCIHKHINRDGSEHDWQLDLVGWRQKIRECELICLFTNQILPTNHKIADWEQCLKIQTKWERSNSILLKSCFLEMNLRSYKALETDKTNKLWKVWSFPRNLNRADWTNTKLNVDLSCFHLLQLDLRHKPKSSLQTKSS